MMTHKIRVFGCFSCLLCAGSLLAQVPTSIAPSGGTSLSGDSGGTSSVTPIGYTPSLLNYNVSGGSASIDSSVDASIRSSYSPFASDGVKASSENHLSVSSNSGDRRSPFSAMQFAIAGGSQFGAQGGFRGGSSAGATTGGMPKTASKLSEAQAWSGAGSKIGAGKDSSQMPGSRLSAKLQSSGFSSQQALDAMGESNEPSFGQKLGGRDMTSASYTPNGFPDSAKGTAMLSPPEVDYGQLFAKSASSTLSFALPDMNNHEFIAPSLRVSTRQAGGGERSLERKMMERLRNGSGSTGRESSSSSSMHKLASQSDIDKLRSQLKSPLSRPLVKPLESESLHSHSPMH